MNHRSWVRATAGDPAGNRALPRARGQARRERPRTLPPSLFSEGSPLPDGTRSVRRRATPGHGPGCFGRLAAHSPPRSETSSTQKVYGEEAPPTWKAIWAIEVSSLEVKVYENFRIDEVSETASETYVV